MPFVPDAKARLLGLVRRGPRTVLWTDPRYGFGNVLYLLAHAHARRARGEDVVVLRTPVLDRWLPELAPAADGLVVAASDVGVTDRRDVESHFRRDVDWSIPEVEAFVDATVLGAPLVDPAGASVAGPEDVVVVVRRGDYWSVPRFRARYAFDVGAYLRVALDRQVEGGGPVPRVHVVSDGPRWCRAHLGRLGDGRELTFADPAQSPRDHFATMAAARRLVVTNTTFGYWGGYVAGRRTGEPHLVVAPRFHARGLSRGQDSEQLDPRWSVVESIPGGWVEPPPDPWDAGDAVP